MYTPILASIFRQHAAPSRPQGLHTAYPSGLQPIASEDLPGNRQIHRRVSRTDLDFEQALRAEGTVVLREGVDVNSLGVDISPSPANRSYSSMTTSPMSRSTPRPQPSTPSVVPPTPSPAAGPSASKQAGSSPASSSQDLFYDADDGERHMNRRSMYRSPGTSSSPDLATLLRKAKERGGVVGVNYKKEKRRESPPPPLPSAYDRATDKLAPSSYSANSSPSKDRIKGDAEWVLPSSRQPRENGNSKVGAHTNRITIQLLT